MIDPMAQADQIESWIEELRERDEATDKRLLELFKEQAQQARHYETLRAQVTAIVLAGAGAISVLAARDGAYLLAGVVLFIVGIFGFFLSIYYHNSHVYHWRQMNKLRKAYVKGREIIKNGNGNKLGSVKNIYWNLRKLDSERGFLAYLFFSKHYAAESLWWFSHAFVMISGVVMIVYSYWC